MVVEQVDVLGAAACRSCSTLSATRPTQRSTTAAIIEAWRRYVDEDEVMPTESLRMRIRTLVGLASSGPTAVTAA